MMASEQKTVKMTAEQQKKHETHIFMQREALMPQRIEKISTTDFKDKSPYVPGATLRLRDVDELGEQGSLTSKEVEKVKGWRCKMSHFLERSCAHHHSIALAAAPEEAAKMTAEQQKKHDTYIFMQREALTPQRIERVSTTDYKDEREYVPGATLRLRDVDELAEQGSLTSKEVERVKGWRCKMSYPIKYYLCSSSSVALGAASREPAKMTAEQQKKHDTLTFMQREALVPQRIERISTTDYKDKTAYVPGATLRLRDVDELAEQGSLKSEDVERVKEWRCRCRISSSTTCAHHLL